MYNMKNGQTERTTKYSKERAEVKIVSKEKNPIKIYVNYANILITAKKTQVSNIRK